MNAQSRKIKQETRREISYRASRIMREIKQKTRKENKRRKHEKNEH